MIVIGIDPGLSGAAAAVARDGDRWALAGFVLAEAGFTVKDVNGGGRQTDAASLSAWFSAFVGRCATVNGRPDVLVVIEEQTPYRYESIASTRKLMMNYGVWTGAAAMLGLQVVHVPPKAWQDVILNGAPGEGKERAVGVCRGLIAGWPEGLKRRQEEAVADAAAIAVWGHKAVEDIARTRR